MKKPPPCNQSLHTVSATLEEVSRKGHKASTQVSGLIVSNDAAVEVDVGVVRDVEASSL